MIFELLGRKAPKKLIEFFLDNPTGKFYEREIQKKTKLSKMSVNKWLKKLVEVGLIIRIRQGRLNIHQLNQINPIVKVLKIFKIIDSVYPHLRRIGNTQISLYGSAAIGEYNEKSDIDVLVIGNDRKIIENIRKINEKIKVSFYTPLEWSQTARKDPAFFEQVEKQKIRLV